MCLGFLSRHVLEGAQNGFTHQRILDFNHILQAMNIPSRILRDFRLMLAGNLFVTRCWVQPRNVQLLNLGDRSHRTVIDYCRLKLSTMFFPTVRFYRGTIPKSTCSSPSGTVDGQNPAPRMMIIPLFIGFLYIPWWLLGISEPSTVSQRCSPQPCLWTASCGERFFRVETFRKEKIKKTLKRQKSIE